jgi:hypothetical protein
LTISQVAAEKARNIAIGMYTHQLIIASSTQRRADQALVICLAFSLAGWVLTALWPASEPALNACGRLPPGNRGTVWQAITATYDHSRQASAG